MTDVARPKPPDSQAPSGFWVDFKWSSPRRIAASASGEAGLGAGRSWAWLVAAENASISGKIVSLAENLNNGVSRFRVSGSESTGFGLRKFVVLLGLEPHQAGKAKLR